MEANNIMVDIPAEIREELESLKENEYSAKSEQEFYRHLICLGLNVRKSVKELEK